jgi:hypothetical protein
LVVGLLAGLSLFLLLATRPQSNQTSVEVSQGVGTPCAVGGHATSCFRFSVTNTGGGPAFATCQVTAATGTEATFGDGTSVTPVNLLEGETRELIVSVVASDSSTVAKPSMTCSASSV